MKNIFIFTLLSILFSHKINATSEICFVGATPNFFKVGHTTIRTIATKFPKAHMRLGLISQVKETPLVVQDLEKSGRLSFHTWPLGDNKIIKSRFLPNEEMTAELDGLVEFFQGCTAAFLVPPIDGRVEVGSKYAKAVSIAKVPYAVVLGVQYSCREYEEKYFEKAPKIAQDAERLYEAMDKIFHEYKSPIKYLVLHVPMFLENILYQTDRLQNHKAFYWPAHRNAQFGYISSKDIGILAAHGLVEFEDLVSRFGGCMRRFDLTINGGVTTADELEQDFKNIVDNNINYKEQTRASFVNELKDYLAKSDDGANTIAELYDEINKGRDLLTLDTIFVDLGYPKPQSSRDWIQEHRECFKMGGACEFPLPPSHHQAPIPQESHSMILR